MSEIPSKRMWGVAVALAVIAGLLAVYNVVEDYRAAGEVDWGHLALAIGIPILFYGMARAASARKD